MGSQIDLNQKVIELADFFVGSKEQGNNLGPEVEMFQRIYGGIGHAWCMSAVQWIVRRVADRFRVKTDLPLSEHCLTVWARSPSELKLDGPEPGAIVIWQHGNSSNGHTGFVKSVNGRTMTTLEGNTGGGAGVVREGDGFYERTRSITGDGSMRVVGFLKAF